MLTIRLRRMGRKDRAFFRFVVSDSRKAPTASAVEEVGHYDPLQRPPVLQIQRERIDYWVSNGATLSNTVKTLIRRAESGKLGEEKPKKAKAQPQAETAEAPKVEAPAQEAKAEEAQAADAKADEVKAEGAEETKPEAQEAQAEATAEKAVEDEAADDKAETKAESEKPEESESA